MCCRRGSMNFGIQIATSATSFQWGLCELLHRQGIHDSLCPGKTLPGESDGKTIGPTCTAHPCHWWLKGLFCLGVLGCKYTMVSKLDCKAKIGALSCNPHATPSMKKKKNPHKVNTLCLLNTCWLTYPIMLIKNISAAAHKYSVIFRWRKYSKMVKLPSK